MRDIGQQLQQQQETEEEKARDASSRDLARPRAISCGLPLGFVLCVAVVCP